MTTSSAVTARIAGWIYLVFAVISAVSFLYIPSQIIVAGDAAATANNLVSAQLLYRIGIFSNLVAMILFVCLVLTLYQLFQVVNPLLARLMVTWVVMVATAVIVNLFNKIAPLILLSGADFLAVFEQAQLEALAYAFLRLYSQGAHLLDSFSGVWLFPFALLIIQSRFMPKLLGYLLMLAGLGYLLSSFTAIVLPHYLDTISPFIMPMVMAELPIIFWLLIVGAKDAGSVNPLH